MRCWSVLYGIFPYTNPTLNLNRQNLYCNKLRTLKFLETTISDKINISWLCKQQIIKNVWFFLNGSVWKKRNKTKTQQYSKMFKSFDSGEVNLSSLFIGVPAFLSPHI